MTAKEFIKGWKNTSFRYLDNKTGILIPEKSAMNCRVISQSAGYRCICVVVDATSYIRKEEAKYKKVSYDDMHQLYRSHKKILITGKDRTPVGGRLIDTDQYFSWNQYVNHTGLMIDACDFYQKIA